MLTFLELLEELEKHDYSTIKSLLSLKERSISEMIEIGKDPENLNHTYIFEEPAIYTVNMEDNLDIRFVEDNGLATPVQFIANK